MEELISRDDDDDDDTCNNNERRNLTVASFLDVKLYDFMQLYEKYYGGILSSLPKAPDLDRGSVSGHRQWQWKRT